MSWRSANPPVSGRSGHSLACRSAAAALILSWLALGAPAEAACTNDALGARARAVAGADARINRLDVSAEEKLLAGLDQVVRLGDLTAAMDCLKPALARQAQALPAPLSGYADWRTDGHLHHFPGNEFAYGRVFVNDAARSYLDGQVVSRPGAAIVKEAFRFSGDGTAHLHEIAVMLLPHAGEGSPAWNWLKADSSATLHQESAPCLACHSWKADTGHQFGYRFFAFRADGIAARR
jgi:hypothetical protein